MSSRKSVESVNGFYVLTMRTFPVSANGARKSFVLWTAMQAFIHILYPAWVSVAH